MVSYLERIFALKGHKIAKDASGEIDLYFVEEEVWDEDEEDTQYLNGPGCSECGWSTTDADEIKTHQVPWCEKAAVDEKSVLKFYKGF